MKRVYVAISSEIVHEGIVNVVRKAAELGEVTVGLLSDEAIATYKRLPILNYEARQIVYSNLKGVAQVVRQDTLSYHDNLLALKPDYVVHGDDWRTGFQSKVRLEVIELLGEWGGELVEVPYTKDVSASSVARDVKAFAGSPDARRGQLRRLLSLKPVVRTIEASNGLSALIAENCSFDDESTGVHKEFDAMWVSSLCDSSFKGKPDTELVDFTSRVNTINEIMEVSTKPIILDGDTGGRIEHFVHNVRTLERMGVSAVIIEDKTGLKQNSLFGTEVEQTQDDPHTFAAKIKAGKSAQVTRDFMIIARIESLILDKGKEDALMRARVYLEEGGADGIVIHSRKKDGSEVADFLKDFRVEYADVPVILIPTSYNHLTEEELAAMGANVVIYANHLLRSAYPAMRSTAESILKHGRSKEVDEVCMPIKEVISFIPAE